MHMKIQKDANLFFPLGNIYSLVHILFKKVVLGDKLPAEGGKEPTPLITDSKGLKGDFHLFSRLLLLTREFLL